MVSHVMSQITLRGLASNRERWCYPLLSRFAAALWLSAIAGRCVLKPAGTGSFALKRFPVPLAFFGCWRCCDHGTKYRILNHLKSTEITMWQK